MALSNPEQSPPAGAREIAPGLFHCRGLQIERLSAAAILVVCFVRDEAWRLPFWLAYHRWLGVDHFIMIDNASTDRTYELLAEQPDVTLISAPGRVEWVAWTNDIIRLCPPAGWSLALDADELFVAPPWRQGGLRQTVQALEAEGAETAFALMVDCYGQTLQTSEDHAPSIAWQRAPWFDCGPYAVWRRWRNYPSVTYRGVRERLGWPRWRYWRWLPERLRNPLRARLERVMGWPPESTWPPFPLKAPLHRSRSRSHSIHDAGSPHRATSYFNLLHYKLDIDLPQKVRSALTERHHWKGSVEYETYARLLLQPSTDLRSARSRRFTGLGSLIDAKVSRLDPLFLSRVSETGAIDTPLAEAEAELAKFGDRHLVPTVPLSLFA